MGNMFQKKKISEKKGSTTLLDCPTTRDSLPIAETPNDNSIETVQNTSTKTKKPSKSIKPTNELVQVDHELPPGLYDDIVSTIDYYCKQYNIDDPLKMHPSQWKSLCIYIGQGIKSRAILQDKTRWQEVGFCYDGEKVAALLDLYEYICGQYKQVPFAYNFIHFAGISRNYFADYENRLTSGRVNIKQKAYEIQKAGLVDAVTGGGSATVANIFLAKALGGLQETSTVVHVSSAPAQLMETVPDLARLGDGSGE